MMYRIVNGLIAIPASLYLTPNTQNTRGHRVLSYVFQLGVLMPLTTVSSIRILNQLPAAALPSRPSRPSRPSNQV